jgi:hypothetical protein
MQVPGAGFPRARAPSRGGRAGIAFFVRGRATDARQGCNHEDFLLSTLRRYVDSLGGKLEVRVMLGDLVLRWRAHDLGHRIEMERLSAALRT